MQELVVQAQLEFTRRRRRRQRKKETEATETGKEEPGIRNEHTMHGHSRPLAPPRVISHGHARQPLSRQPSLRQPLVHALIKMPRSLKRVGERASERARSGKDQTNNRPAEEEAPTLVPREHQTPGKPANQGESISKAYLGKTLGESQKSLSGRTAAHSVPRSVYSILGAINILE